MTAGIPVPPVALTADHARPCLILRVTRARCGATAHG
jgi:hypothetical protein